MKYIYWTVGIFVLLLVGVFGLQLAASERVEVVELHTIDAEGEAQTTRLWIVDDEGYGYLRASGDDSGWLVRLLANETFELTRDGSTQRYEATLRRDKNVRINQLMQEKYTWGNTVIAVMVGSRENSIPVELHPLN